MPDDPQRRSGPYGLLAAVYIALVGGLALAIRASGRPLPKRVPASDIVLLGVATFKLSRIVTRDRVAAFIRSPFARYERPGKGPEVIDRPTGHGLRRVIGELVTCPFCLAQWIGTGLAGAYVVAPRATRVASATLAAVTVADMAQYAHTAAQDVS